MTGTGLPTSEFYANVVGFSYPTDAFVPPEPRAAHTNSERSWLLIFDGGGAPPPAVGGHTDLSTVRDTLDYYKGQRVVHRNTDPSSILVASKELVVIDYGIVDSSLVCAQPPAATDFRLTDNVPAAALSGMWLSGGKSNVPERTAPPSAQFISPSIWQKLIALFAEQRDTPSTWERSVSHAHTFTLVARSGTVISLDLVRTIVVSGSFVADAHQAYIRYIDGVITALSLVLVQVLAALSRLGAVINLILVIIAVFFHYGHRHEPGDDDSLHARRNWTSLGSVPAIS
jgi:hypothetical protein